MVSTRALGDQLSSFASVLEQDGERPALPDLESLFCLLYRRARRERRLAIAELAGADDPVAMLGGLALSPFGRLFDEARTVLAQELDSPATHFSLLAALSIGPADYATIEKRSRVEHGRIGRYLATLAGLQLVTSRFPVTDAERRSHARLYLLADGFLRFWFRYVFPFEADLEAGSRSGFTPGLIEAAAKDQRIRLVDVPTLASG